MTKREEARVIIKHVMSSCSDDSWKLLSGDIVNVGDDIFPSRVYRQGFGPYGRHVRVARLDEDPNKWSNGRWAPTDQCFRLDAGDRLRATGDVIDATKSRRMIPNGSVVRYKGRDADGDISIKICGSLIHTILFFEDLMHFSLE